MAFQNLEQDSQFKIDDLNQVPPSDIVTYNELRSCADLVRMSGEGVLDLTPDFQREFIWSDSEQTRFIDSLTKQLPIPSMCLAYDHKEQRWIVIDGLQRLSTIVRFLGQKNWTLSKLVDIDPGLAGKSLDKLRATTPLVFKKVQNLSIPINVLRCDLSKADHLGYIYTIFHRLNAGGVKLNNQEIRNCIFHGPYNAMLHDLASAPEWRQILHIPEQPNRPLRFISEEIVLRIMSFAIDRQHYAGSISAFLNSHMKKFRYADHQTILKHSGMFRKAVSIVFEKVKLQDTTEKTPIALLEALFVGIISNLGRASDAKAAAVNSCWKKLRSNSQFGEEALAEGLSKKAKVDSRLSVAIKIFSKL